MDWQAIWNSIVNFFKSNAWNILWFFVILVVGIIVIKIVLRLVKKLFSRTKIEKMAQQFVITILKFVLYLALILLLLSQIGVEISGILTACSAVILAVGMALQNSISNVANGIIIISNKMFKKGDYIITGGVEGQVTDINFLFTTLITTDNKKITLPNSNILNGEVTNLGAYPTRRVDFMFSVAYETDVELVKKIVTDVMKSDGRVLLDPAPFCRLKVLGASSIDFAANCWCDNEDYWSVYYYVMDNVYNEFKRNNISVPYNQLEVRLRNDEVVAPYRTESLPERVEKIREEEVKKNSISDFLFIPKKKKPQKKESPNKEIKETKEEVEKAKEKISKN